MGLLDLLLEPHPDAHKGKADCIIGVQQRAARLVAWSTLSLTVLAYIKLRSWLAVSQLVAIYRKVRGCVSNQSSAASAECH